MSQPVHSKAWSYAALLMAILCIAWSAIFVRWTSVPGPVSAFYRCLIPAIVLLPTWLLPGRRKKLSVRTYAIIAIGGFFFLPPPAFFHTPILQTHATHTTPSRDNTPPLFRLVLLCLFSPPT